MAKNDIGMITMEAARIGFRNFSGNEGRFNAAGVRNFVVFLDDPELVAKMAIDGWNIKYLKPRDDEEEPQAYLPVAVNYRGPRPPTVVLITSRGRADVPEDNLMVLDFADIANVDLIVRPYVWDVNGKTGVKAYLKGIYVTLNEDELELKYADVPDSAQNTIGGTRTPLQIESGGRIPVDPDEIVIEEDGSTPW